MIKPLTAAIGMALLAGMNGAAWAQDAQDKNQDKAVDLDQVIVTGTRTATAIDKIPGAITLVSKEEVQRTLSLTEDATAVLARTVPGYAESSQAMSNTGETIDKTELKAGDLVFFNTLKRQFSHVGIYLGDNRFIHSSSHRSGGVRIDSLDSRNCRLEHTGVPNHVAVGKI